MTHLQAVVFDFDGVIADSEPLHLRAFQQALREEGLDLDADEYFSRYLGYDDVGVFTALSRDRSLEMTAARIASLVARKGDRLRDMLRDGEVIFPGAASFISEVAAVVPVAIASGALRHEIDEIIDGAGLTRHFTAIVASGDTNEGKPSPEPYQQALRQLERAVGRQLNPARCVAIEDSAWGLESARGAGLRCVGVTTSYGADQLSHAELIVPGLEALSLPLLERLCGTTLSTI